MQESVKVSSDYFRQFASIKQKSQLIHRVFSHFGFLFLSLYGFSQAPKSTYPLNYFNNPLRIPIALAANFGELRQNHFHMGLDIRTENRVNLPVYASADGYIARIKVEPFGFGQAIYINHPNGYTTVYAHLNKFFPALERYVRQQQYKKESWKIMLDFAPVLFPVKKGELIAYSGNTGGSLGPHLHFEIRRTSDDLNLNPMLFNLPIPDNTDPVIQRLALYDGTRSVYDQTPKILPLIKSGGKYSTGKDTIKASVPVLGLAIGAFDTQTGSRNPNGIFKVRLSDNNIPMVSFELDSISYLYTRNINGHIDYKTKALGGPWLQQIFILPGLTHSIYKSINGNGFINLEDGKVHTIVIEVADAYGNHSLLRQNFLYDHIKIPTENSSSRIFHAGTMEAVESDRCSFYICENCLYDSAHINISESDSPLPSSVSGVFSIGNSYIPLQDLMVIRIKPSRVLSEQEKNKVVMMRTADHETEVKKVDWQNDWATGQFRDFGQFQLVEDNTPPVIRLLGNQNKKREKTPFIRVSFVVTDDLEVIKNVRATLDGEWLRCTNDKEKAFIYKDDKSWAPGKHELKIVAEDEAGNRAEAVFVIG
jgi:murein DD-endopeptidase MepM/ murein hydrolase activator NlpD